MEEVEVAAAGPGVAEVEEKVQEGYLVLEEAAKAPVDLARVEGEG